MILTIVGAMSIAAGLVVATGMPVQAAVGDPIVYEEFDGVSSDIWIMNADGTGQTDLTPDTPASQEYDPKLSADGTRVAFISNRLTDTNPDANFEVFVMSVTGSDVTQLTLTDNSAPGAFVQSYDPTWSPDGTRLAFSGYRGSFTASELYTINADGTDEVQLTTSADFANKWEPDWSPDGSVILFTWGWDEFAQDLHVIQPDGTGETDLTPDTVETSERNPQWSPDGTRIAFRTDREPGGIPPNVNAEVYVMEYPSLVLTRVTDDPAIDENPTWSPDGAQIVFSSTRGGTYDLYVVDAPPVPGTLTRATAAPQADGAVPLNTAAGDQNDPFWGTAASTFRLQIRTVGSGSVLSRPSGISCGTDCREGFLADTTVTLKAFPSPGFTFAGWEGACTGVKPTCRVMMDRDVRVQAHFVPAG
jgi:uncharacterized repeat protein (TIGR02543 family)